MKTCMLRWICIFILIASFCPQPVSAQSTGYDLAFLTGTVPTIDGVLAAGEWIDAAMTNSNGCIGSLPDAPLHTLGSISASLPGHNVTLYTKRDNTFLYLALDIDDATTPALGAPGDQVFVYLDPNHSRDSRPQLNDFKLEFITFRGSAGADGQKWYKGTGSASGTPWAYVNASGTLPPNVSVARQNRPSGIQGYVVEIKIPFADIGYTLSANASSITDIGIAVAVVNDMGFQAEIVPEEGDTWVLSGAGYPNTPTLQLTNASNVIDSHNSNWDSPQNWGSGFLAGSGEIVYIDRIPEWWRSHDIKAGFVNAANFVDAGSPGSSNPKWYKYKSVEPCIVRVWAKIHRRAYTTGGTGIGAVKRRVLFLWAEHGANPQKWYYITLTQPITLNQPANMVTPTDAITTGFEWNMVPPGKLNHPCLRVFILPEVLTNPTITPAWLAAIGTEAGDNAAKLTQMMSAYQLGEQHVAQLNIDMPNASFSCPGSVPMSGLFQGAVFASIRSPVELLEQERTAVVIRDPGAASTDLIIDISAYGAVPAAARRNYSFVQELGGVEKIVNVGNLRVTRRVKMPFWASNSADRPRAIFLSHKLTAPSTLKGVRVDIPQPRGVFSPKETRIIEASCRMPALFISLLAGVSLPHGNFGNAVDPGFAGTLALEYLVAPNISAMAVYSRNQFKSKIASASDVAVNQISAQAKYYIPSSLPYDVFVNAGASSYSFSPGSSKTGYNVGIGGQYDVSQMFGLIAAYNFHSMSSSGTSTTFSSIQGGIYFGF